MSRAGIAAVVLAGLCRVAAAGAISSGYTDIDTERDCATFASADDGEGDWANMVCSGWRGYPVLIYADDLRESVFYGFSPGGDLAPAWESFSAFNAAGPRIEWRIETEGSRAVPFAAIQRWSVSADPENPDRRIEVLVVAKVGQMHERLGCAVGLVLATGNPRANEQARRIADERARNFVCGTDKRVVVGGSVPDFSRSEN